MSAADVVAYAKKHKIALPVARARAPVAHEALGGVISIRFTQSQIQQINALAVNAKVPRSEFLRSAIALVLKSAEVSMNDGAPLEQGRVNQERVKR